MGRSGSRGKGSRRQKWQVASMTGTASLPVGDTTAAAMAEGVDTMDDATLMSKVKVTVKGTRINIKSDIQLTDKQVDRVNIIYLRKQLDDDLAKAGFMTIVNIDDEGCKIDTSNPIGKMLSDVLKSKGIFPFKTEK